MVACNSHELLPTHSHWQMIIKLTILIKPHIVEWILKVVQMKKTIFWLWPSLLGLFFSMASSNGFCVALPPSTFLCARDFRHLHSPNLCLQDDTKLFLTTSFFLDLSIFPPSPANQNLTTSCNTGILLRHSSLL